MVQHQHAHTAACNYCYVFGFVKLPSYYYSEVKQHQAAKLLLPSCLFSDVAGGMLV
jgi:hypothetical protein